jgi:hypothetical protein
LAVHRYESEQKWGLRGWEKSKGNTLL